MPMAANAGAFEDFYNMLDDFFSDSRMLPTRSLLRDTFKIDIAETDGEYVIEAELPGVSKEQIELSAEEDSLCISVTREENNNSEGRNFIHRERRVNSMSRRVRLANTRFDGIKAKLEDGVLSVTVPKVDKASLVKKINIG
ncbi:MAG: Hsp20/alpha crystallin family protein [Oscillospiraceae bacterium]|nr:Hsp20/alpha crystallin family protein [Oscillospiraceae bacterium]